VSPRSWQLQHSWARGRRYPTVLLHYAAGGRTIPAGPYAGVGRDNPNKHPSIQGFTLTDAQRDDVMAFLRALTDESVLDEPRFANPWRNR
jgi:cytochrome c peroxidase